MSRPGHRAPRREARFLAPLLGILVVLGLGAGGFAATRRVGDDAPSVAVSERVAASTASSTAVSRSARRAPALPDPQAALAHRLREIPRPVATPSATPSPTATAQATPSRAEQLARRAARKAERAKEAPPAPIDIRVGSFNVLGSQHTAPGGDRRNFPPASVRSAGAANLIAKHGVDIVGMQELQTDQLNAIRSRTGLTAWPGLAWGSAETDNSILYDGGRFEFVSGSKFIIPFMGRPRPQPILRLRDRETGREFYVVNTHPSAHDGRYLVERRRGQATLVSIVNQLKQSGLPVLVTGDMNDREEFYCHVVPPAGLVASNGGSYSSGCRPPPEPIPVDWVVGSGVTWSGYWRDTAPITNRISDHFFISATAHVG